MHEGTQEYIGHRFVQPFFPSCWNFYSEGKDVDSRRTWLRGFVHRSWVIHSVGVDSEFARLQAELTESASLLADLLACSTDPFSCLKVSMKTDSLFSKCSEFIIAESTISYACRLSKQTPRNWMPNWNLKRLTCSNIKERFLIFLFENVHHWRTKPISDRSKYFIGIYDTRNESEKLSREDKKSCALVIDSD